MTIGDWGSLYSSETATPGYYAVNLKTYGILAEMTATLHAGMSRYTFSTQKGDANILLDAGHRLTTDPVTMQSPSFESRIKILSKTEMEGSSQSGDFCNIYSGNKQTIYFAVKFSKPAIKMGTWKDKIISDSQEASGSDPGAFFQFSTAAGESIEVKVGISYVSVENARKNLEAEIPGWDFDEVREAARKEWDENLSRIKITGGTVDQLKVFYTALYHALIHPSVFSDVNGQYQSMGHRGVKTAADYVRYDVFSLWDTYRNLHPFLGLFYPERELDMVKTLVEISKESGWLPQVGTGRK